MAVLDMTRTAKERQMSPLDIYHTIRYKEKNKSRFLGGLSENNFCLAPFDVIVLLFLLQNLISGIIDTFPANVYETKPVFSNTLIGTIVCL